MVAVERLGIRQLDLGCGADSLQFHGGSGFGKRSRCVIENSAMAASAFLRRAGTHGRILRLHNCFWPPDAGRADAASVAIAVESSADAPRAAFCRVVLDLAPSDDRHGFN